MRWGRASPGALTWVRPLQSIVATFGPETEGLISFRFASAASRPAMSTRGHRFLAPEPFRVRRLDDYVAKLQAAKVILDPSAARRNNLAEAKNLAFAQGFELVGRASRRGRRLVEWPVVLMGSFDEAFLEIPPEVIRTTIRTNQKCFVLTHRTSPFETRPAAAPQGEGKDRDVVSPCRATREH